MGFTIFESSGTFNPSTYGLTPGDVLHIIAVGGGAGGCGAANNYTPGTNGGASSFGSVLTAAGGLAPSNSAPVTPQTGSFRGAQGIAGRIGILYGANIDISSNVSVFGGCGADGWIPGVCMGRSGFSSMIFAHSQYIGSSSVGVLSQDKLGHTSNFLFTGSGYSGPLMSATPSGTQQAGSGGIYVDYGSGETKILAISGAGGIGYGAGGGGGCCSYYAAGAYVNAGAGGNSGVIAQKDYVLTSTASVSVTVGLGGAGGSGYAGGAGANGCVAIFW